MLIDLNVHWPQESYSKPPTAADIQKLKNTLVTLEEFGYTHIVLNFTLNHSDKVPSNINPINLSLLSEFKNRLTFFTRVTIIVDEPSQGQSISKLQSAFDIIAVLPVSEKGLLLACTSLDIDLITFNYNKKLPTFLKHKTIGSAIKRGIKFEITYSSFLNELTRSQFLNNSINLIRASRNQNLIISSGANSSVKIRSFNDILIILKILGFKQSNLNLIKDKTSTVLLNGRLRLNSYKQTIMIGEDIINDNSLKRNINDITNNDVFKKQMKRLKK